MPQLLAIIFATLSLVVAAAATLHPSSVEWAVAFAVCVGVALYLFMRSVSSHAAASVLRTRARTRGNGGTT